MISLLPGSMLGRLPLACLRSRHRGGLVLYDCAVRSQLVSAVRGYVRACACGLGARRKREPVRRHPGRRAGRRRDGGDALRAALELKATSRSRSTPSTRWRPARRRRAETGPRRPSCAALFDDLAPAFDDQLQNVLQYKAPELIASKCAEKRGPYAAAFDAGCGTRGCWSPPLQRYRGGGSTARTSARTWSTRPGSLELLRRVGGRRPARRGALRRGVRPHRRPGAMMCYFGDTRGRFLRRAAARRARAGSGIASSPRA